MHNHVINESPLRIEQRRVMRLSDRQLRCVVHAEVLHGSERATRRLARANPNVTHVADIENAHRAAHGLVFSHKSAAGRILDRHIPSAEINHLGSQSPVQRVERRLAEFVDFRRVCGFHSSCSGEARAESDTNTRPTRGQKRVKMPQKSSTRDGTFSRQALRGYFASYQRRSACRTALPSGTFFLEANHARADRL